MIFFPAIPIPPTVDDFAITTVEWRKEEFASSASTTSLESIEDSDFSTLEDLIKVKENGNESTSTTVAFREEVEKTISQELSSFNYFTEDYDLNSPVKIKKILKVKAKVRSVKKVSPKIFID